MLGKSFLPVAALMFPLLWKHFSKVLGQVSYCLLPPHPVLYCCPHPSSMAGTYCLLNEGTQDLRVLGGCVGHSVDTQDLLHRNPIPQPSQTRKFYLWLLTAMAQHLAPASTHKSQALA